MIHVIAKGFSRFRAGLVASLICISGFSNAQAGDGSVGNPFTSLGEAYGAPVGGRYYFDLGSGPFQADIDTSEGGGWVLVLQYVHQGGTNPNLSIIGAGSDLPVTSSASLGADESGLSSQWGHAGNAAMSQFQSDIELRWYGQTSGHNRIIHFRSSVGDDYVRTGSGNFSGIESAYTVLTGHSAGLPYTHLNLGSNHADGALTEFPYYRYAFAHWGIRGQGNRWEVDDYPDNAANDTIHRVWVRIADPLKVTRTQDSGDGTLRAAIAYANAYAGQDDIIFDIAGAGPHTITLSSALPTITDDGISIDATTQAGSLCGAPASGTPHTLRVRLDSGSVSNPGFDGLTGTSSNVRLRGLSVTRMRDGIVWSDLTSGLEVHCSYVGLSPDGVGAGNYANGLYIAGSGHSIGGLSAGDGNVISGNGLAGIDYQNAASASIQANAIGTNPDGLAAIANGTDGILLSGTTSNVTLGGTSAAARNLIAGNLGDGIHLESVSDIDIYGNYIGLGSNGSTEISNGEIGIHIASADSVTIGNGSASGRNVMGSAANAGVITTSGTYDALSILHNYIGTDLTGNTALANGSGHSDDGLRLYGTGTNITINDNVIAGFAAEMIELWDIASVTGLTLQGNHFGIGVDGSTALPSGRLSYGMILVGDGSSLTNAQIGGTGLTEGNRIANGTGLGLQIRGDAGPSSGQIVGNLIYNNGQDGIEISQSASVFAIYSNRIYGNGDLGIDIATNGVTANDVADSDTGTNEGLNFPVLNTITADGTTSLEYDFNLDVPSNGNGYRVEFFQNSSADPSGHGEGEIYLGYIDLAHSGGDTQFTGNFTASQAVSVGTLISATTTRKTGVSSFDISSEFAANSLSVAPGAALLDASRSLSVYDPGSVGLYMTPGNDLLVSLRVLNIGTGAVDAGSIELIDHVGNDVQFYNSTTVEFGNAVIGWNESLSGLSFTPATDLAFSDAGSAPANFAACSYIPSAGYDPNVTYICFNPKGAMASGDPDPEFTLQYRLQIE